MAEEQLKLLKAHIPPFGVYGSPRRNTALNKRYRHTGIDIYGPIGTPIIAAEKGKIFTTYKEIDSPRAGNTIELLGEKCMTRYLHLETIKVDKGANVEAGETIGTLGITGNAKYARLWIIRCEDQAQGRSHLHFEARERENANNALDPLILIEENRIAIPVDVFFF
jgi:murein DD-endopeptidase MepM/ murein hydrolase activator NlpD